MRYIEDAMKAKLLLAQQTLYNNAELSMETLVLRPALPITRAPYWQESIASADAMAVSTSVAIRRTGHGREVAYLAYVDTAGLLTVRSATVRQPIRAMVWTTVATIPGCTSCALEFDGNFVRVGTRVEFITDALPWLFYVTSAGQLMAGIIGEEPISLLGSGATALDSIRGMASTHKDEDQGLLVFYIAAGAVYYQARIAGVWEGPTAVSIAPADAVSVRAERTWDWRIVLQVRDSAGGLYEVFTRMMASGWNGAEVLRVNVTPTIEMIQVAYVDTAHDEYLSLAVSPVLALLYANSPVMVGAVNVDDGNGNYGLTVEIEWDENIFGEAGNASAFVLTDEASGAWGGQSLSKAGRILTVIFSDFNNASGDATVSYTPGTMTGDVVAVAACSVVFTPSGLVPVATEPPAPIGAENIQEWEG